MDAAKGVVRHFERRTGRVTAEQQKGLSSALKDEKLAKRTDKTKNKKNHVHPANKQSAVFEEQKKKKTTYQETKKCLRGVGFVYYIVVVVVMLFPLFVSSLLLACVCL